MKIVLKNYKIISKIKIIKLINSHQRCQIYVHILSNRIQILLKLNQKLKKSIMSLILLKIKILYA